MKKSLKNASLAQRYLECPPCAKSGKAMPGSGGKEWANKLATNIEQEGWGARLAIFEIKKKNKKVF